MHPSRRRFVFPLGGNDMINPSGESIRKAVRERYARAAAPTEAAERAAEGSCCGPDCCASQDAASGVDAESSAERRYAEQLGYSTAELEAVPEGAYTGLGCGNPIAHAEITPGSVVVDLGSGAGVDCFLAARRTGRTGRVIGVDMTPEMVERARNSAAEGEWPNVEFRLGEIEALPVADGIADLVVSNCVVNLSPAKETVFAEAFRVLRSGGVLVLTDILASDELPETLHQDLEAHAACLSGAVTAEATRAMLEGAGFTELRVEPFEETRAPIEQWVDGAAGGRSVVSALVRARKP